MVYIIVLGFIIFDVITGLMKAVYKEGVSSTILRQGLFHKLSELIAVAGAGLFEQYSSYLELGVDIPALKTVAIYICIMELISIIENLCEVNEKMFGLFKPYLQKLKGTQNEEGGEE